MSINLKSARAKFREVEKNHAVDSDQWNQAVIEYHTEIAQVMLTDESWLDNKDFLVEVSEAIYRDLGEDYGFKTEKLVEARESIPVFNTPLVSKGGAFWCNDTAWLDGLLILVPGNDKAKWETFDPDPVELYCEQVRPVVSRGRVDTMFRLMDPTGEFENDLFRMPVVSSQVGMWEAWGDVEGKTRRGKIQEEIDFHGSFRECVDLFFEIAEEYGDKWWR